MSKQFYFKQISLVQTIQFSVSTVSMPKTVLSQTIQFSSIWLFARVLWHLTKKLDKKLDGSYIGMQHYALNKSWKQIPKSLAVRPPASYLRNHPSKTSKIYWALLKSKDELWSDIHLWTTTFGHTCPGRQTRTVIHQLCAHTGYGQVARPSAIENSDRERERERESKDSVLSVRHDDDDDDDDLGGRFSCRLILSKKTLKPCLSSLIKYASKKICCLYIEKHTMTRETVGSIPGRFILKTQKMVPDTSLLNTQYYKVYIKGKVKKSRKRVTPSLTLRWCSF